MGLHFQEVNFAYYLPKSKKKPINFTLKDINLSINKEDEFIAVIGHTGSGKSTLVQLMNALLIPSTGKINLFGNIVEHNKKPLLKPIRQQAGLVFQFPEYQLFEETVIKDISFGPKNFGFSKDEAHKRALEAAKMMNIKEELLDRTPFTLSGGEMRKVAIAGILASNPDVLILDEPTVGLDPVNKREMLELLRKFNQELHKTIIIITHDMDVVGEYAKKVLVLKEGNIVHFGDKDSLFSDEEKVKNANLDYPEMVKVLRYLNEKLNLNLNYLKYNKKDAYEELKKVIGEKHE
ncbi:MAG: ATP-binding cassette domain-containing protein [Bacilli bacterium]|jgi:energy-coupling factor transport system ATP-binding protein